MMIPINIFFHLAWQIMDGKELSKFERKLAEVTREFLEDDRKVKFINLAIESPAEAKKYFEEIFGGWDFWAE